MRYLCVHCDQRFEHDGDDKPRCPKCMRRHGLERLDGAKGGKGAPTWAIWAGVFGVIALVGGGYAWWSMATPGAVSGDVPLEPLDASDVRDWLAHDKVDAEAFAGLLVPGDAVEDFAEKATEGAGSPTQKAKDIVDAIGKRADAKAFVQWSLSHPRDKGAIRTADQTLKALKKDGARRHLYPLEVAALAVAALRAVDVPAMLVEAWKFPGDRSPPDPSGNFGYYLVGVWPKGEPSDEKAPELFDPYGARGSEPADDGYRVLNDIEAIGAAMSHEAAQLLVNEGDTSRALSLVEGALKLDGRSPAAHTVRGAVLLQTGGPQEGSREIQAAAELRDDAPRRKNHAALLIAQGNVDDASSEIASALDQYPDYADAHAMLAAIHLSEQDAASAKSEIETAERLDPHLPNLSQLWAQLYLAQGDVDRAVAKAKESIANRPHNWQVRLNAAQVFRAASRFDDMRRQAHAIVDMVPADRQAAMRRLVEQVLGPTALEKPADEVMAGAEAPGDLPSPGKLDLGKGSALLGKGDQAPSLGGGGGGAVDLSGGKGQGPLLLGGDPSKLKLRQPGQKLQLDLNE